MFGPKFMVTTPKFNTACLNCISQANEIAVLNQLEYITLETLLLSLLISNNVKQSIEGQINTYDELILDLTRYIEHEIPKSESLLPVETKRLEQVLSRAFTKGLFYEQKEINEYDLLLSILAERDSYAAVMAKNYGLTKKVVTTVMDQSQTKTESNPKALNQYCVNMTLQAQELKLDPCYGRESEIDELEHILSRRTKHNALMIGDPGVGKTAIVEGLAIKIHSKQVPKNLLDCEVWSLDIAALIAGTKYRGDLEERFKQVTNELGQRKNAVLFVDEAHMLNSGGNSNNNNMDISNMLKPGLSRRQFKVIAATTWEDYRKSFEKDRAFMRRFNRMSVTEPSTALTVDIVKAILPQYKKYHKVSVSDTQIERIVDLTTRWMTERRQPDKSIDIMDAAMTRSRLAKCRTLDDMHIMLELSKATQLPVDTFGSEQSTAIPVTDLDKKLKLEVFGQDEAIHRVLERIYIAQAGLKSPNRPLAQFLFLGPTGTGKTALARSLSDNMRLPFAKFDMSEYQEQHSVSKLIGAPPGYVGYEDSTLGGGLLISAVEKNPHCVILMDEIEKADPRVSNILLQVMDSGWLTSSNGKRIDCRNVILILTSNLGAAQSEKNSVGFVHSVSTSNDDAVKEFFAPEFRNRLDAVIKFEKLSLGNLRNICDKFVREINQLLYDKNISVKLQEPAYSLLLKEGYDSKMGARPMGRAVDRLIKVPLSQLLISSAIPPNSVVEVDAVEGKDQLEMVVVKRD